MINKMQNDLKKGLTIQEVCKKYDISFLELFHIFYKIKGIPDTYDRVTKYVFKNNNRYMIMNLIEGVLIQFRSYFDLNEAISVRDKLIELNWDADPVEYMGDMYIVKTGTGKYKINKSNGKRTSHYGTYSTLEDARKVRDCLVNFKWDKAYLPLILRRLGVERVGGN